MKEDAERRDLTINGMFFDPIENKLIDYVGGQKDLGRKIIRLIGDPEKRIQEDKLRLLRVVRFTARFSFEIEKETLATVKRNAPQIMQVSPERIFDELKKILKSCHRTGTIRKAIELLFETSLMEVILPEVFAMKGVEQPPDYHPEGDVLEHTIIALEYLPQNVSDELLFGVLLHDIGKPVTYNIAPDRIRFNGHDIKGAILVNKIMERFKTSKDFSSRVESLVENHMRFMNVKKMRISTLKRFLRLDYFEEHKMLHKVDCLSSHGSLENLEFLEGVCFPQEEIKPKRLFTGDDLIALNFKRGPLFREILDKVEDEQLEGRVTTKEGAIKFVLENYAR